jgi:hypothetical protein
VTDGTSAGTLELAVAGAYRNGLFRNPYGILDPQFSVFGQRALFAGFDAKTYRDSNNILVPELGLFITDGTSTGTKELKVAGASVYGLSPGDFTVLGSKVLFDAWGACGDFCTSFGLWVTDGTSAGTKQLRVAAADADGFFIFSNSFPPDLTALGSKALFQGADARGQMTLWSTDGTSAGTRELKVPATLLDNHDADVGLQFTLLRSKALFIGNGRNDSLNLWVTDGTSAGTKKLKVMESYYRGLFYNGEKPDFTVIGGRVIFVGVDRSIHRNLYSTNGTAVGTSKLQAAGSSPYGLFGDAYSTFYPDFTAVGKKAVFAGDDAKGFGGSPQANLWVTDGTSEGTGELTVAGASSGGLAPTGFAVLGNKVLFSGAGAQDLIGLWVTDATSAGTQQLTVRGAWSGGLWPSNITSLSRQVPNGVSLSTELDKTANGE